jgi:hypothetical protein
MIWPSSAGDSHTRSNPGDPAIGVLEAQALEWKVRAAEKLLRPSTRTTAARRPESSVERPQGSSRTSCDDCARNGEDRQVRGRRCGRARTRQARLSGRRDSLAGKADHPHRDQRGLPCRPRDPRTAPAEFLIADRWNLFGRLRTVVRRRMAYAGGGHVRRTDR